MKPFALREKLAARGITARTNLRDDLVVTRADGRAMYFRAHPGGMYDWAANRTRSSINQLDFRRSEERPLEEAVAAAVAFVEEARTAGSPSR
jgi:hypothetical protein